MEKMTNKHITLYLMIVSLASPCLINMLVLA